MRLCQIVEADVNTSTGEVYRWHDRHKLLQRFLGDPSVFVHFSDINKLGVNPSSDFNTPIGIYAYPVSYVLSPSNNSDPFDVPFAGSRKYAHVFRVRDLDKCLVISKDSVDDFKGGVMGFVERFFDPERLRDSLRSIIIPNNDLASDRWLNFAYDYMRGTDMRKLYGYVISNDINVPPGLPEFPGEGSIAGFVSDSDLGRIKFAAICNINRRMSSDDIYHANYSDVSILWFFTMAAADVISRKVVRSSGAPLGRSTSVVWSKILRDLGVSGVIDNGFGIIHTNEPTQAVFFDIRNLVHLDVIKNTYLNDVLAATYNFELSGIASSTRRGDFRAINVFTSDENIFVDWVRGTLSDISSYVPSEVVDGRIDENSLDRPFWGYLNNAIKNLRAIINMDTKRLVVCKSNGGDRYDEIRPLVFNSVNGGIKLIRGYFDNMKAWFDRPRGRPNNEHSVECVVFDEVKMNLDALYKVVNKLGRSV